MQVVSVFVCFTQARLRVNWVRCFCRAWKKVWFGIFAEERSLSFECKTLMRADGAPAHRLEEEKIQLVKLPAEAPELNPVERFFQPLRSELE